LAYNRVLLIKFTMKVGYGPRRPPVGLGYIAEALKRQAISYEVIDCDLGYGLDEILEKGKQYRPDLVGISMVTLGYLNSYYLIKKIKEILHCDILVGGPHISTLREQVLLACPEIDFGIVGEGDNSIVQLCQGENPELIPGLIYRSGNVIQMNPPAPPIQNLDALGFPTYPNFELDKYYGSEKEISLVTSRGCPYGCTYCSVRLIMGPRMRFRTAKSVVDEIEYWVNRNYRMFTIMDDNFSHKRERIFEICDEIERKNLTVRISLANGVRADRVDYDMLKRLREVGAFEIQIGVESANDRILKILKKGENLETISKAVEYALELGYDTGTCFLVGSPGETVQEVYNSFDFVLRYPLSRTFFFNIIPYPGTVLYDYLKEHGLMREDPDQYLGTLEQTEIRPVFETPEISMHERIRLLKQSVRISEKVRRRFLRKRFARFGIFSYVLAFLASWNLTEPILKRSRFFSNYFLPFYFELRDQEKIKSHRHDRLKAN
jgi:anaerobic magnesium-protoporphyrin IX monomethyl ester cyclase